jgi:hypothetical protein
MEFGNKFFHRWRMKMTTSEKWQVAFVILIGIIIVIGIAMGGGIF